MKLTTSPVSSAFIVMLSSDPAHCTPTKDELRQFMHAMQISQCRRPCRTDFDTVHATLQAEQGKRSDLRQHRTARWPIDCDPFGRFGHLETFCHVAEVDPHTDGSVASKMLEAIGL